MATVLVRKADAWVHMTSEPFSKGVKKSGFHGQGGEDKYCIENFFGGVQHGTYLEMGAFNGIKFSNTLHLHETLGWRGLLIEPNPSSFCFSEK